MKFLHLTYKIGLVILILTSFSCEKEQSGDLRSEFDRTENEWLTYFSEIGYQVSELKNEVLLISHVVGCSSCMREIDWWNTEGYIEVDANISIILIERHEATFKNFVENREFSIPIYWDKMGLVLESKLVQSTPVKLYFDGSGNISELQTLGAGDLRAFLSSIE